MGKQMREFMTWKRVGLVFLLFLVVLGFLQFTSPHIIGFDGYWNAKHAELIRERGFIQEFPYVSATILSENYANIQVLFHILLVPFSFFGLEFGTKLAAVVFGALAFAVFYWFLRENKTKYALFFTLLYFFASAFLMFRFMLPRQMPLAIAITLLTLYFLQKKKYLLVGLTVFVYGLLHSSFVLLLVLIGLYFILEFLLSRKLEWKLALYAAAGLLLSLLIHPNFPDNISLLFTQIMQVNLVANFYNVEWKPWTFMEFVTHNVLVLLYIGLSVFFISRNKKLHKTTVLLVVMTIVFFIYTLLARRMHEYLAFYAVLLLAFLFTQSEIKLSKMWKYISVGALVSIVALNGYAVREDIQNNDFLHNYGSCANWIKENAPANSLIFTNAYVFPYLFSQNTNVRYTHGLDLTYSYLHDEQKFERYMGILQGAPFEEDPIVADYQPDYVFSGKVQQDVQLFEHIVAHKENYQPVFEDEWCAVLEVA